MQRERKRERGRETVMVREKLSTANEKEFRSFRTMEITGVRVGETESKIISGSAGDKPGQRRPNEADEVD